MNKKAQATIFIIIGLVILLAAATIFIVQRNVSEEPLEAGIGQRPQSAGQTELQNFVQSCLQTASLQGMEILRLQGGYIDSIPNTESLTVKDTGGKYIENIDGSKKVVINPNLEGNKVPYWLTSNSVAIPSLSFMENELENYVEKETVDCIGDFSDFRNQGFNVEYNNVNANVEMGNAVVINVKFPITLSKDGLVLEENDFIYNVPVDMQLIQKTASDLVALEDFHTYLEEHTKNLISLYSGVDQNRLPPFSRSTTNLDCSYVTWNKQDVKNTLKNMLDFNMQNLKVAGTSFTQPTSSSQFKGVYDSFVYDLFLESIPNLRIDFDYENSWEFLSYDVIPSSGNFLSPERIVGTNIPLLPQICVFKYPFKYTMQFPVLAKVTDVFSAKINPVSNTYSEGEGFTFQFPMVAYLCGNQNRICNPGDFPKPEVTGFAVANTTLLPETLFCNPEQRISNDITISTFNSQNQDALGNVDVNYYCGSYQNDCYMGRTDANGILKTKFPLCINGQIYLSKDRYDVASHDLTTHEMPESEFDYFLEPKNNLKVELKKVSVPSLVKNYFETDALDLKGSLQDLVAGEKANIISDTGLFYIYPDPADRAMQIGTGIHNFDLQLIADIEIKESIVNGQVLEGFEGNYPTGSVKTQADVSTQNLASQKITFYVLAEHNKDDFPATWNEIDDPILDGEGNLDAELLYSCEKNLDETCNLDSCSFVAIDGNNIDDFADNDNTCERAFNVTITKEQYEDLVKPQFS